MSSNKHKYSLRELNLQKAKCPKCGKFSIIPVTVCYDSQIEDGEWTRITKGQPVQEVECINRKCSYTADKGFYERKFGRFN